MYSIGDFIDKLIIENIKLFTIREQLHKIKKGSKEYIELYEKMMMLNKNRNIITNLLDEKIGKVVSKKEKNQLLSIVKTYK